MSSIAIEHQEIETPKVGKINVYIQGIRSVNEVVILTMHDVGCNYRQFAQLLDDPCMDQFAHRCVWVHVEVPGQGDGEEDLPSKYQFPSLQDLADDLIHVLDTLDIQHVVVLGDGAGANVLARFAMAHDERVYGAVLIHCTGSVASFVELMRNRLIGWRLNTSGMSPMTESALILHRFGSLRGNKVDRETQTMIESFRESLRTHINPRNLSRFLNAFITRNSILDKVENLRCPVMFMTGTLASHNRSVAALLNATQKSRKDDAVRRAKLECVQVDGVASVLNEKTDKVAECLQYFLQGLGLVSGFINRRMSNTVPPAKGRVRSLSMEEYDKPKGAEVYLFDKTRKYSTLESPTLPNVFEEAGFDMK